MSYKWVIVRNPAPEKEQQKFGWSQEECRYE